MLSGFACAVPAIMATRTMERRRDRLLTMLVVPLMTCSARLPVYTLLIGALFPTGVLLGVLPIQSTLMVAMYFVSVLMALLAALVLSKTVLVAPPVPLVLELPPYRLPRFGDVLLMMWQRTRYFLSEAGTVILACTIVLWGLLSFPRQPTASDEHVAPVAEASSTSGSDTPAKHDAALQSEALRNSYAGRLGHAIEPLIAPLGFDWKIGVGLIGAFAAREVFVATMGIVYSAGADVDEESVTLRERMRAEVRADGTPVYSPLSGLSLMVFFALACQCMSTLAVVKRETGGYRWPAFMLVYMSVLAWVASFVVYQGGRLLGFA
jgi:ferrous iron transport protein B